MNRQNVSAARRAFDATEPGSCGNPLCPRPKGPHGWCIGHSCGNEVPEAGIVCRLKAGHDGHWHDSGSQCWLVEATFTGPDPGADRELMVDAVKYVLGGGLATPSPIQRNIRVGFGKAQQLLMLMEDWGLVGPRHGSMARTVLCPADRLPEVVAAIRATGDHPPKARSEATHQDPLSERSDPEGEQR
jgi:hypothetical protein